MDDLSTTYKAVLFVLLSGFIYAVCRLAEVQHAIQDWAQAL